MGKSLIIKGADFSAVALNLNVSWKVGFWNVSQTFKEYTDGSAIPHFPNYASFAPIPIANVDSVIVSSGYSIKFIAINDEGVCVNRSNSYYEGTFKVGEIIATLAPTASMFALNVTTKECAEAGGGDAELLVDMRTKLPILNDVIKFKS